jgi:hypothetical protein
LRQITWFAPEGVDPKEAGYYAAQANASRIFLSEGFRRDLSSWNISMIQSIPDIAYVASGGFSKPQLYPASILPTIRILERILARFPDIFATRLLVVLEKKGLEVGPTHRDFKIPQ